MKIDQDDTYVDEGTVNPHKAKLVYTSTDGQDIQLVVKFTPSANATPDVHENAVPAELYFSTTTDMTYPAAANGAFDSSKTDNMKSILKFSNVADGHFNGDPNSTDYVKDRAVIWQLQPDGTFTATYDLARIQTMIQLDGVDGNLYLKTKDDYDNFKEHFLTGNVVVHVTDGTVQSSGTTGGQG